MRLSIIALGLLFVGLASGCSGSEGSGSGGKLAVVTSLELFADMVRNVGGDRIEVGALLPAGSDPHTYELPPGRVADVARADIVFVNGLGLEESIEDVVTNNADGPVIELTEGLPPIDGGDDGGNPHMWLNPQLANSYVEHIRDELIALDPGGAAEYEANATAYMGEIDALDAEFAAAVQSIPAEQRKLVTFHDAYPYLADRYGLDVVGVVVPSPGQEPSAQDVADLVRTLRSTGVPAAFSEPEFNADVLEQAAAEANVRVLPLLSDAYSEGVHSYLELMRFDMRQLQDGLGGS